MKKEELDDLPLYRFHPKVWEAYTNAGEEFIKAYLTRPEEENQRKFWKQLLDANKTLSFEQVQKIPKRYITKLIRQKVGRKEYFFYHEQVKATNVVGSPIHFYHRVGFVEIPNFLTQFNEKTRQVTSTDIDGYTPLYELEWPQDFTDEIKNLVVDDCDLVLIHRNEHYGGYSLEQFLESSFDDLLMYGKFGTINPLIINEVKKQEAVKRRAK